MTSGTDFPRFKKKNAPREAFTPSFLHLDPTVRRGSDVWRHGNQLLPTKGRPRETLEADTSSDITEL